MLADFHNLIDKMLSLLFFLITGVNEEMKNGDHPRPAGLLSFGVGLWYQDALVDKCTELG